MIHVPEGWRLERLGNVAQFVNGRGFKPHEWGDVGLPIIRIQNLNGSREFNYYNGEYNPKLLIKPGTLLFAWSGSKGSSFGPHFWRMPTDGLLNYHTWKIECGDQVKVAFLYQALRQLTYTIESKAQGAAGLVHIQKGWIEDWETPMPPLEEQGAIAEILSIWDDSITKAELLLAARTELKKGLMQQLLMGRTRFKEFVKSPKTTGTHFGPYPSDWELRRVGEFLKESRIVGSGGDVARKLSIKLYGNGIVARRGTRSGSEHTQYYRRSSGQFIYSKLDFLNGAFAVVPDGLTGYESTLDLPAFDVSADLDVEWFLCFVCRREFYRAQVGLAAGGRKAKRVNAPEFLHMRIPVPSLGEQKRIAAVLNVCDREIELLQKQLVALKEQKRGLMQKLLTGEIRVKV